MGVILIIILIGGGIAVFFTLDSSSRNQIVLFMQNLAYRVSHIGQHGFKDGLHTTQKSEHGTCPDLNVLNCRVSPVIYKDGSDVVDAFSVEMCGSIRAPEPGHNASLSISITDITEGLKKIRPVRAKVRQWQKDESQEFYYISDLGKFPNKITVLSDWANVARLRLDWMLFPRMGTRVLQFDISIISTESKLKLASSQYIYEHDNKYFGYIDLQENVERSKTLAVALAFSVCSADGNLHDCEIDFIKKWARENINNSQTTDSTRQRLEKALDETVAFFQDGNHLNTYDICMEIAEIIPMSNRYDILEFCMQAAKTNGAVVSEMLKMVKDIAGWLEIDCEKFRTMMERIIPIDMLDTVDVETILGVTSDMTGEKAREHLNKEYAKWNSRVTNSDPKIQTQADQMLKLIAEARSQYTKKS
jgi:hypothetical protein